MKCGTHFFTPLLIDGIKVKIIALMSGVGPTTSQPHLLQTELFHMSIWQRSHRKHLEGRGPLKKNLEGDRINLLSVTFKASPSGFACSSRLPVVMLGVTLDARHRPAVSRDAPQCSNSVRSQSGVKKHL